MRRILLAAFIAITAAAQTQIDLSTQARRVDFSAATATRPIKTGTELPATCAAGEMFFKTDAPSGANVYGCSEANQWAVQSGYLTIASGGTAIGSRTQANFLTGPGLISIISDTGEQIDIGWALDTAVVQTQAGEQRGTARLCASQSQSGSNYRCALDPTATAYARGMVLHWIPDVSGTGGPTTLNVDTLGAARVKLRDGVSDPSPADIAAGQLYAVWYDGAQFRLTMPTASTTPGPVMSVFGRQGAIVPQAGDYTTDQVTEGGRLYFTDARARAAVDWSTLSGKPATFAPAAHAANHRNGGGDEIATATPAPNAIPKAGSDGKLDAGWIPANGGGLGYTAENAAMKGQPNGYASLDGTGKVPLSQLASTPAAAVSTALVFDGSTTTLANGSTVSWTCGSGSGAQCTTDWTVPERVSWVRVQAWGGGGGGSGSLSYAAGGGGGGGGYYESVCPVTPGASVAIAVGLGGAGGSSTSGDGGNSVFGTCFTVTGGMHNGDGANGNGWGGALANTPRTGWFAPPQYTTQRDASQSMCIGADGLGYGTSRLDGGGCGAGQRNANLVPGQPGGSAVNGGGGGGSGAEDHASGGQGGTSVRGGAGGNGGAWTAGTGQIACTPGSIPGGGGGGAGGNTSAGVPGCAGARGEVRVFYVY